MSSSKNKYQVLKHLNNIFVHTLGTAQCYFREPRSQQGDQTLLSAISCEPKVNSLWAGEMASRHSGLCCFETSQTASSLA